MGHRAAWLRAQGDPGRGQGLRLPVPDRRPRLTNQAGHDRAARLALDAGEGAPEGEGDPRQGRGRRRPGGEKQAERQAQKAPKNTVHAVAEDWLKRDQASNRRLPEVKRILDRDVLPAIGDMPITDLRKRDVIGLIDAIADRGSGIMANRTLGIVKRMLTWAAGRDIVESNVAQFVEPPADEIRRERVLSDAELIEVWRAADALGGPYGAGVKLLMLTAGRREEIFGLSEPELDLDGAAIRLPASRTKVKEGRTIPLSPPAVAILRALPRLPGPYLLSATGERPWCDFPRSKRYLDARLPGMAPWVLHDIRRSVATGLQRLGARLETIEAVLGHVSGSRRGIVGIYQRHAFEAEARHALDAWGRHVEALLSGEKDNVVAMTPGGDRVHQGAARFGQPNAGHPHRPAAPFLLRSTERKVQDAETVVNALRSGTPGRRSNR